MNGFTPFQDAPTDGVGGIAVFPTKKQALEVARYFKWNKDCVIPDPMPMTGSGYVLTNGRQEGMTRKGMQDLCDKVAFAHPEIKPP